MARVGSIVHVVDDDPAVLEGLERLLTGSGHHVECHASAEVFLFRHDPRIPGCAIIDLSLPGLDGLALQERLCESSFAWPVIFLSGTGDLASGVRAMKRGAVDFLTKPVEAEDLLAAVDAALERDSAARAERAQEMTVSACLDSLTPREREVLEHVVAGRLNKQIAGDLGTAIKTVKTHRGRMMRKMGARTLADLIRVIVRREH